MGSVFYNVSTNCGLFEGRYKSLKDYLIANRDCNLSHVPERLKDYSPAFRDLIVKMLAVRPEDRPKSADIIRHPWIRDEDYMSLTSFDELVDKLLIQVPALISDIDDQLSNF